jgi:hypothetical protein
VVLKTIGATRAQIRASFLVEFGLLGLTAGLLATTAGTAAAWGPMIGARRIGNRCVDGARRDDTMSEDTMSEECAR